MINSTNGFSNNSASDSKIKMMAHQYKKFLSKNRNHESSKYAKCFFSTFSKIQQVFNKIWKFLMPIYIRGTTTPFQQIIQNINEKQYDKSKLPFSYKTVSQVRFQQQRTYSKVIQQLYYCTISRNHLIYCKRFRETLYESEEYIKLYSEKVKQILDKKQYNIQSNIFVILWKGLFNQILILDVLPLENQYTYFQIMELIDKRQEYQLQIKKITSDQESYLDTNNSTSQKLTPKTRSSSIASF